MLALNLGIVVAAIGSAAVLAYAKETVSNIPRIEFRSEYGGALAAEEPIIDENGDERRPPLNFLLVGVDSIVGLPEGHPLRLTRTEGNTLTDTMILLRVDPESGDAAAMSIPRDLWVPIAEPVGYDAKINAAVPFGGPETLVATIQNYFDIPIHRYVQVNFNGFLGLVDEIGGVEVQIDYPLRDRKAQFEVTRTGCVTLSPEEALGYVRSRTLQGLIDGGWRVIDGTGDFGRISRQQDFLVLALNKAFDEGLTNPSVLKGIVDNVIGAGFITLDTRTTPNDMLELASDFANFRGDELERLTLPVQLGSAEGQSVVRMLEGEAQDVLAVFRGERDDPRSFRLVVQNGTPTAGLAAETEFALTLSGFRVVETKNADNFQFERTIIKYDPSQIEAAEELERWLTNGAVLDPRNKDAGRTVDLIIGADWAGLLDTPRPLAGSPESEPESDQREAAQQVTNTDEPTPRPMPTPTPAPETRIRGCS